MGPKTNLVAYGIVGWAVCGGAIAIGRTYLSMSDTLLAHAIIAPMTFALLSWHYSLRFPQASPLYTASGMLSVVIGLDALVVAPFFERDYAMFRSMVGTWLPFASILAASYFVGRAVGQRHGRPIASLQPRKPPQR